MNVQFSSQGLLCTLVSCLLLQHSATRSSERDRESTFLQVQTRSARSHSATQLQQRQSIIASYWLTRDAEPKSAAQAFIDWTYTTHIRRSTQQERQAELKAFLHEAQKKNVLAQVVRPMLPIAEVRATLHQIHPAIVERQALAAMKSSFTGQAFQDMYETLKLPQQLKVEDIGTIANLSDRIFRKTPLAQAILHADLGFALDCIKLTRAQDLYFFDSNTHPIWACNKFIFFATALYTIACVKPETLPKYRIEEPPVILLENLISISQALENELIKLLPFVGGYGSAIFYLLNTLAAKILREHLFEGENNSKFTSQLRALILKIYSRLTTYRDTPLLSLEVVFDKQENKTNISSFLAGKRIEQVALPKALVEPPPVEGIKSHWIRLHDRYEGIIQRYCSTVFSIKSSMEGLGLVRMQQNYFETKQACSRELENQLDAMQPNTASGSRDLHGIIMSFLHGNRQAKLYQAR